MVAEHDAKKEAKIGANLEEKIGTYLEAKIGTYLEVKRGAKWDANLVVAQMDAILDVNLDANMVLIGMSFRKQKRALSRKQNRTLFRKQTSKLFRKKSWIFFRRKKIDAILDVINDAI